MKRAAYLPMYALFLAAAGSFLSGCGGGGGGSTSFTAPGGAPTPTPAPTGTFLPGSSTSYRFILGEYTARAVAADPTAGPLLDGTQPMIVLTGQDPPYDAAQPFAPAAWNASYVIRFSSEADMAAVFAAGGIPAYVSWVMYDNEPADMPPTPATELPPNDPGPFFAAAATLAHAHGKRFAATAGMSGSSAQSASVDATATAWDLYAVQTQTGEMNLTQFARYTTGTMAGIWAVNPSVSFSVGVGDYANGGLALAPAIDAAMATVPSNALVWMNFGPHPGGILERDDIAIQVIKDTATIRRVTALTP